MPAGEAPTIAEYESRYPEHARKIRDLLPSVAMMEQLKRRARSSKDAESESSETLPDRLGEYRIIRELGRGGMGIVYEAVQESLGRHVALKVIPRHGILDSKRRLRFQREAQAVARLHHTNIVPIFAVGEHEGLPYYAMQYIAGNGLDQLLETWRREGIHRDGAHWRFVAKVGIQAAEALQYAHDQGILHRDIKPANLLIDEHQVAWITDFGLAKLIGREDLTESGDVIGTLRYLAPESLRGQTDHRSDIYSLGLTLYELLTLQPPFGDLSPSELLRCVTAEQPARPRALDQTIPHDLETIILKATAREPGDRYATAGALADDLRSYLDDRPILARRASALEQLTRWCRRNRWLAAATATAAASLLLAAIFGLVGYALTTRALIREELRREEADSATKRAEANVALSLRYFSDLFNKLADRGEFDFVLDGLGPNAPPIGRRHQGGPFGGPHGPDQDGPFGPPRQDPGGPPGPPRPDTTENNAAILQTVLEFFDEFAERNETDSRLQGEAAQAHRKVAALYRRLGHDDRADEAHARAMGRFERLVVQYPKDRDYRFELARTYALDDQYSRTSVTPERLETGIKKALPVIESLAAEAPDAVNYVMAQARWKARLAGALHQLGRSSEAETYYRQSIAHDESLLDRVGEPTGVHLILATNREALANVLMALGKREDARKYLDQAADELESIRTEGREIGRGGYLADKLSCLADSYSRLGEKSRAADLKERANRIRPRGGPQGGRGGGGRPAGAGDDHRRPGGPQPHDDPPPRP